MIIVIIYSILTVSQNTAPTLSIKCTPVLFTDGKIGSKKDRDFIQFDF